MASFTSIRSAIKSQLQAVTELAYVYSFHNPNIEGYPACSFDVSDAKNDFLTNTENVRKYSWQIVVYQEITVKGLDLANTILDATTDAVISKLETNMTLGSVVDFSNPVIGNRETIETPSGLVRAQYLTLVTTTVASV